MARKDRNRQAGSQGSAEKSGGQAERVRDLAEAPPEPLRRPSDQPSQSPLFHAEHAARYQRQELISAYEQLFDCRLIVVLDVLFHQGVALLEELLYDADPERPLHMILYSPGGDGEAAVRIVRSLQARCSELTVIVPDIAKSAATILAMGAHRILMGPTSDLGPVDPQFQTADGSFVSAKDLIAAVEAAEEAVAARPDTYPLHAALLSDVTALQVQQGRSALDRTDDLVEEALKSHPGRTPAQVKALKAKLRRPLVDLPKDHSAVFGAADAKRAGLPVESVDPRSEQWQLIWRLFAKYLVLGGGPVVGVYEGLRSSRLVPRNGGNPSPQSP